MAMEQVILLWLVLISLSLTDNIKVAGSVLTGSSGTYCFFALPSGIYSVIQTPPPGYVEESDTQGSPTDNLIQVNLGVGTNSTGNDFVDKIATPTPNSVPALVATPAPTQFPLPAPTTTTSSPVLLTPTLLPGLSSPASAPVVAPATPAPTNSQPTVPLGSICGNVTVDLNGDGTGDSALAGVNITLFDGNIKVAGSVLTGSSGTYCFFALPSGIYSVIQMPPPGYVEESDTQGSPTDNLIQVNLGVGTNSTGNNFVDKLATPTPNSAPALVATPAPTQFPLPAPTTTTSSPVLLTPTLLPGLSSPASAPVVAPATPAPTNSQPTVPLGSICGNVTVDLNGDGTGDSALARVNITLFDGNIKVAGSVLTGSSGTYCFFALPSGIYSVIQMPPPGYVEESDTQGSPTDNLIQVNLGVGTNSTGNNFVDKLATPTPNSAPALVATPAPTQFPLPAPTTTTSSPVLLTPTLLPGLSSPASAPVVAPATPAPTNSQPTVPLGSICGNVTVDLNGGGTGDSALARVNITLFDGNIKVAGSVLTGSSGTYCFFALPSGIYSVIQMPPPGYVEESDTQGSPTDNLIQVNLGVGTNSTGNDFVDKLATPTPNSVPALVATPAPTQFPLPVPTTTTSSPVLLTPTRLPGLSSPASAPVVAPATPAPTNSQPTVPLGSICGNITVDLNGDGTGDSALARVNITLFDGNIKVAGSVLTGSSGTYCFFALPSGIYSVIQIASTWICRGV